MQDNYDSSTGYTAREQAFIDQMPKTTAEALTRMGDQMLADSPAEVYTAREQAFIDQMPKTTAEALTRMGDQMLADSPAEVYTAREQAFIDQMPKTTAEALTRMGEQMLADSPAEVYTAREQAFIDQMPKNIGEAMARSADRLRENEFNPEYYPKVAYEDHDQYKLRTTGAMDEKIAQLVDRLSVFEIEGTDVASIEEVVNTLMAEPASVSKLMERRMKKTSGFLYGWDDFSREHVYTDMLLIAALQDNGFDFSTFKVDLSTLLGEDPKMVDLEGMLLYYSGGLMGKKANGKDIRIPNPYNPSEIISPEQLIEVMRQNYRQNNPQQNTNEQNMIK